MPNYLFVICIHFRLKPITKHSKYSCMLQVDFEDVIGEPDGVHSADLVWKASDKIYTWSKYYWYFSLSAIFALPLSLIWGLLFAFLTFWRIWAVVPTIKICVFVSDCLFRPLLLVIKEIVHPLFKAVGKLGRGLRGILRREA